MNPQGISIHVAVNRGAKKGLVPLTSPAENAQAMQRIAEQEGFKTQTLVGPAATCDAVIGAIREAVGPVGRDGILLLTYSGHGSVVPSAPGGDEVEDQCWCLYDGDLVDDKLYRLWAEFEPGARIVVISDSCNGGGMIRTGEPGSPPAPAHWRTSSRGYQRRNRSPAFPPGATYGVQGGQALAAEPELKVAATVLLLGAAGKRQQAMEHHGRSHFTAALLEAWEDGAFQGSYLDFYETISGNLKKKGKPEPIYDARGAKDPGFQAQRPFTITPPSTA